MPTCIACAYLDDTGHCVELEEHILQTTGVHVDTPKIDRSKVNEPNTCPCFERPMTKDEALVDGMDWMVGPHDPFCAPNKPGDTVDEKYGWRK